MDLIELTTVEQSLQDSGVSMTLKDIADKYGKRHADLNRSFSKMVDKVGADVALCNYSYREFTTSEGNSYKTVEMDLKTLVWFIAKFDDKLRLQVINYAFEKLEEDHIKLKESADKLLLAKDRVEKELLKEKSSKLNEFNGYMSVSKLRLVLGLEAGVSELLDVLEDQNIIESETITKTRRVLVSDLYGDVDKGQNPRFTLDEARELFKGVK